MIVFDVTGLADGDANMQADIRSASECLRGRDEIHIRLYRWNPAAISLGAHQSPDIIDHRYARIHGVDVVTRPTGGGAILHTDELTYCVTLPAGSSSPSKVFDNVSSALVRGLQTLGLRPDPAPRPRANSPVGRYQAEPVCFSGIARNEISVGKRKLVGSAQRVYRGDGGRVVILQHGSILFSDAHSLLPAYLVDRHSGRTAADIDRLRARSTSLTEQLGRRPEPNEVIEAIRNAFSDMRETTLSGRSQAAHEYKEVMS